MNRIAKLAAAVATATLLCAPAALADDGTRADGKGKGLRQHKPMPAFETLDKNHDGGLDKAELKAAFADKPRMAARLDKMFGRMDGNGDGKVQKAEQEAWKARRKAHGGGRGHGGKGQGGQGKHG